MNFAFDSRHARGLALLCALIPATLVGGCGGGGSSSGPLLPANPTPTPVSGTPLRTTSFRLPGGQIGILTLSQSGNGVAGELRAFDAPKAQLLVPSGTYPVRGAFTPPNSFKVTGQAGTGRDLTLVGTLPDANTSGSYNLTLDKISYTGTLPSRSFDVIPASTPYAATGNLKFSDFEARGPVSLPQFPFDLVGVAPNGAGAFNKTPDNLAADASFGYIIRDNVIVPSLLASGIREDASNRRRNLKLRIEATPDQPDVRSFFVGQTFDLTVPSNKSNQSVVYLTFNDFQYLSIGGSLAIKSIGPNSATLEFRDVKMANDNSFPIGDTSGFPNDGKPLSTFLVNGTFEIKGLQTSVSNP